MKKLLILLSALLTGLAAGAQPPTAAFKDGERLEYAISYRARLVPQADVAEVTLTAAASRLGGQPAWRVTGRGRVKPFFRWFFDLNDTYDTWLDPATLRPLRAVATLNEGDYRYTRTILFDWSAGTAASTYRNLKWDAPRTATMALGARSFDALSLFYDLRCQPRESFVVGRRHTMQLVMEKEVKNIGYQLVAREQKTIKGMGRFRTLKFRCQLVTSSGKQFEEGSEFYIWLSDDGNMIPLYIESPIRVGSIQGTLTRFSNLKYPLDSRVR